MALVDQKTDLKSLKYSDFNTREPFVVRDINRQPESRNQIRIEGEARKDDVNRLSKLLATNLKFATNQAFLNSQKTLSDIRAAQGLEGREKSQAIRKAVGRALSDIGQAINTQIAQAGVAGTGTHFITNFKNETSTYLGKFGGPLSLTGAKVNDFEVKSDKLPELDIKNTARTNIDQEGNEIVINPGVDRSTRAQTSNYTQNNLSSEQKRNTIINLNKPGNIENRFYQKNNIGITNKITITNVRTEKLKTIDDDQIIPFEIAVYDPKKPLQNKATEYLYFTAYITSLGDRYGARWNSTSYIGRGEPLFNYTDFSRGISLDFKIAAESVIDLQPLYNKINRLVGTTAPSYSDTGVFKRGVFVKLTVGDYIKQIPGFFTSVDLQWNVDYPWEIGRNENGEFDTGLQRVPHILDISLAFQPVHSFIPEYGKNFILNI